MVRPESLIRFTTSVCNMWVRSTPFTARMRSLTCSWPHWSAGLLGMIFPKSSFDNYKQKVFQEHHHTEFKHCRSMSTLSQFVSVGNRRRHDFMQVTLSFPCRHAIADLSKLYVSGYCPLVYVHCYLFRWSRVSKSEGHHTMVRLTDSGTGLILRWDDNEAEALIVIDFLQCDMTNRTVARRRSRTKITRWIWIYLGLIELIYDQRNCTVARIYFTKTSILLDRWTEALFMCPSGYK